MQVTGRLVTELTSQTDWNPNDTSDLLEFKSDVEEDIAALKERGIFILISKPVTIGRSYIFAPKLVEDTQCNFKISLGASHGNQIVLSAANRLRGSLSIERGTNLFVCRPAHPHYPQVMDVTLRGPSTAFYFGSGSSSYGMKSSVEGSNKHVIIGDDCLLSDHIKLFATDHHSIIDLSTGLLANEPANIKVGNHVWLGLGATILKGVNVGEGSIVGAAAVVVSDVQPWTAVAGVPATAIKSRVSWARTPPTMMAGKLWRMTAGYRFEIASKPS